jgi:4-amino-4-deoxy-L-arabinose transferase-like glycosyltransferase
MTAAEPNITSSRKKSKGAPMNSSTFRARFAHSWPLFALIVIAAIWLHRTPYSASNLEVTPDTVEYALAPLQLLETGRYEIMVEGRGLPPRYPPWFPVLVVLPAYVLFGSEPGNAILPITVLAVAGVGFAYAIGKRISSTAGGVLAALAVLVLPPYSAWSTQVMTDVPCTALMLGTCLLYLHLRAGPGPTRLYFAAGVLVAVTTLFRPVCASMLLPFLLTIVTQRKRWSVRSAALLAPMAAAAAATFAYNAATFGSPFRNGYKVWVPVPMDYPSMIFSRAYFLENLGMIILGVFPVLLLVWLGAWLIVRKQQRAAYAVSRQTFRDTLIFFVLSTVPITLFHLFYFFPHRRFHIPLLAGTAVLAASMLALLIGRNSQSVVKMLLPAMFFLAVAARTAVPAPLPLRRFAADQIRRHSPENAIVLSAIEPVYLARLAGVGSARRFVPLSRKVEYASKLLAWKRIEDPRLSSLNYDDERALALVLPHAESVVRFVASERMDELAGEIARGRPVFLESLFADRKEPVMVDLEARFNFVQRAPFLFELRPR